MKQNATPATITHTLSPARFDAIEQVVLAGLGGVFPAAALTVIQDGAVCINAAWGWLDPDTRRYPALPTTLFDLASLTKLFTTTAFLSSVTDGAVNLDDTLASVVPEFAQSGLCPLDGGQDPHTRQLLPVPPENVGVMADPQAVTFRHLLTHTSGLAPWRAVFQAAGPLPPPPDQPDPVTPAARRAAALRALCTYPFVGQPGDGVVRYSDIGLMLLGEALCRLDSPSAGLDELIRRRITEPLQLDSVTFNPMQHGCRQADIAPTEYDSLWRSRRCWGEVHDENACGLGGVAGHAGLFGTASDVAAFGQAWLERDSRLCCARDLMDQATTQQAESAGIRRGLGWMLKPHVGAPCGNLFSAGSYGHTGYTGTSLWIDPERALVVACLTNRVYFGRAEAGIQAFRPALHDAIVNALERL